MLVEIDGQRFDVIAGISTDYPVVLLTTPKGIERVEYGAEARVVRVVDHPSARPAETVTYAKSRDTQVCGDCERPMVEHCAECAECPRTPGPCYCGRMVYVAEHLTRPEVRAYIDAVQLAYDGSPDNGFGSLFEAGFPVVCMECGESVENDSMPIEKSARHYVIDGRVIVGCEGYFFADPARFGIERGHWQDWRDERCDACGARMAIHCDECLSCPRNVGSCECGSWHYDAAAAAEVASFDAYTDTPATDTTPATTTQEEAMPTTTAPRIWTVGDRAQMDVDMLGPNAARYLGVVFEIVKMGPKNALLRTSEDSPGLRCPIVALIEPNAEAMASALVNSPEALPTLWPGTVFTLANRPGLWVVLARNSSGKYRAAKLGGDGGRYLTNIARSTMNVLDAQTLASINGYVG
jgi:hypothetical protein